MAKITADRFERIDQNNYRVQDPVDASYSTFIENGDKLFQIVTYGSSTREVKGVVSQSIRFDKAMAKQLVELLTKEFSL
ncbi:MAG: methionyl-tRNA formyltransferase [Clostridiales Family XIII bacterium]|jgi:hypothetical protein|nr:methionyl-tRNA formyltransferase [Clostridiales Family XIII bacterium]